MLSVGSPKKTPAKVANVDIQHRLSYRHLRRPQIFKCNNKCAVSSSANDVYINEPAEHRYSLHHRECFAKLGKRYQGSRTRASGAIRTMYVPLFAWRRHYNWQLSAQFLGIHETLRRPSIESAPLYSWLLRFEHLSIEVEVVEVNAQQPTSTSPKLSALQRYEALEARPVCF